MGTHCLALKSCGATADLQPFTEYSCQVQAGNSAGKGDWSSKVSVRTAAAVTSAPVALEASGALSAGFRLCLIAVLYAVSSCMLPVWWTWHAVYLRIFGNDMLMRHWLIKLFDMTDAAQPPSACRQVPYLCPCHVVHQQSNEVCS